VRRALLVGLVLLAFGARGQGIDMSHGGPVEITARDGMEWRQAQQMVVARGDARAVRGEVTVTADELIAYYRKKAGGAAATPAAAAPASPVDTGSNEIYRLEAVGHVNIYTPTDHAVADRAVYDIDQAVLVLTGHDLKITTPQDVMTARDSMEYWSQKHMGVGRGEATVTTSDGRRLYADTLVAYTLEGPAPGATQAAASKPGDPAMSAGKLKEVEAFGNVEVRTATETVHGDRAVYVPATEIARVVGNVRVTRGQNQLNGDEALVNMRTGVSTISRAPGGRVEGLVVPNDPAARAAPPTPAKHP